MKSASIRVLLLAPPYRDDISSSCWLRNWLMVPPVSLRSQNDEYQRLRASSFTLQVLKAHFVYSLWMHSWNQKSKFNNESMKFDVSLLCDRQKQDPKCWTWETGFRLQTALVLEPFKINGDDTTKHKGRLTICTHGLMREQATGGPKTATVKQKLTDSGMWTGQTGQWTNSKKH